MFRVFLFLASAFTIAIFVLLLVHFFAIWPLYVSHNIRGQAKIVMTSIHDDRGVATSFFDIRSLRCQGTSFCQNSVTTHSPPQGIRLTWQQNAPSKYSIAYDHAE
jgi:hypothetical protein